MGGGIAVKLRLLFRCNLKTVAALCFLCAACSREEVSIRESDLSRFRKFLSESLAFNYCGCHFTNGDVKIASEKFSKDDIIRFYFAEHKYMDHLIGYLHLLESFEKNVLSGSEQDAIEDAKRIAKVLRSQRNAVVSPKKKFSLFSYERHVVSLLYSIVRIRESGRCRKNLARTIAHDVLGDELINVDVSKCDWIHIGTGRFSRLRRFRDFVLLSFHIEDAKDDPSGVAEYVIGTDEDARLAGVMRKRTFRFVSSRSGWTLLWSKVGFAGDFMERFSFVPQVDGVTSISDDRTDLTGIIHLSSDFSRRRREIFRRGETLRGARLTVGREYIIVDRSHSDMGKEAGI